MMTLKYFVLQFSIQNKDRAISKSFKNKGIIIININQNLRISDLKFKIIFFKISF